jgi:hypothetical protein
MTVEQLVVALGGCPSEAVVEVVMVDGSGVVCSWSEVTLAQKEGCVLVVVSKKGQVRGEFEGLAGFSPS